MDESNPCVCELKDIYPNAPKEFANALINMYDTIENVELEEARSHIFKMAQAKRKAHKSMEFPFEFEMGDHEYVGDNINLTHFHVYVIINVNVLDDDIAKGLKFNGRKEEDISRIISRIRNDQEIYPGYNSVFED